MPLNRTTATFQNAGEPDANVYTYRKLSLEAAYGAHSCLFTGASGALHGWNRRNLYPVMSGDEQVDIPDCCGLESSDIRYKNIRVEDLLCVYVRGNLVSHGMFESRDIGIRLFHSCVGHCSMLR
jgi:hypothetical protein